jgi:hypothetical protein
VESYVQQFIVGRTCLDLARLLVDLVEFGGCHDVCLCGLLGECWCSVLCVREREVDGGCGIEIEQLMLVAGLGLTGTGRWGTNDADRDGLDRGRTADYVCVVCLWDKSASCEGEMAIEKSGHIMFQVYIRI